MRTRKSFVRCRSTLPVGYINNPKHIEFFIALIATSAVNLCDDPSMSRIPLTVLSVRFAMFCDVPVPSYRGLFGYLEFNELSRLPPVFVSAALETAVLLPKFIRACPNALLQRTLLPS